LKCRHVCWRVRVPCPPLPVPRRAVSQGAASIRVLQDVRPSVRALENVRPPCILAAPRRTLHTLQRILIAAYHAARVVAFAS
jgi:hypothetical protein